MSATSNPTVKAVPTASTASKDLPFVGQVFFLTGRGKECKAPEGCGMERGRLRPILSLKTSTETFGSNPSSRNGFATTTAAKFWPFTTPQQSLYCIATPESSPAYFTTAPYRTDFPESGFPSQRSLVGLSPLNSAPYFTAEVNLTHPNPVYPPTTAHVVLTFPNPAHHNRPHVVRPPSNFGSSCSTGTLLYAVTSCLQVYPSAATSPVGPLGRTPFSPPPLYLAIRIRQTQKRGRCICCTGLFTKRDAVN